MMPPLILVENFFSRIQFPLHTVAGDEEPAGVESWHVADGRRTPADRWGASTSNASHTITATCNRPRYADCVALDRGHNLAGREVILECSDDNFVTSQTVLDTVLPAVSATGSLGDAFGVRTEEGAWLRLFPGRAATYWRLRIPAMGVGLVPQIVGLWLGASWQFGASAGLYYPWSEDGGSIAPQEAVSDWGWRGRGPVAPVKDGALTVKLATPLEYDQARYHLQGHFAQGRPMWICYDQSQGDRTFLAIRAPGRQAFEFREGHWPQQAQINYVEHEAMRVT